MGKLRFEWCEVPVARRRIEVWIVIPRMSKAKLEDLPCRLEKSTQGSRSELRKPMRCNVQASSSRACMSRWGLSHKYKMPADAGVSGKIE